VKPVLTALLLIVLCHDACLAQGTFAEPKPVSTGVILGVNTAIGAATAAIGRAMEKKPIGLAAAKGAGGGLMIFGAKLLVSRNNDATNLIARSLGAFGSSAILNSARDRPMFEQVAIPYGPVRIHVDMKSAVRVRLKLDLAATISTVRAFNDESISFDKSRSVLSGVMTFRADTVGKPTQISGMHRATVVAFRPASRHQSVLPSQAERTIGHEFVHVLQYDFLFNALGAPAEDKIMPLIPGGRTIHRFIDVGFHAAIWAAMNASVPYSSRPWEREAASFAKH